MLPIKRNLPSAVLKRTVIKFFVSRVRWRLIDQNLSNSYWRLFWGGGTREVFFLSGGRKRRSLGDQKLEDEDERSWLL